MHEPDPTRAPVPSPTVADRAVAERLVVGVALTQRAARAAVARPAAAASPRRDGHGGRAVVSVRQRRGVVLVFVVVLLTLLGIMGTAYLASSRLDRQAIVGRGSLTGTQTALLKDSTTLDAVEAGVERAVKIKLIRDLFNIAPGYAIDSDQFAYQAPSAFRQPFSLLPDPANLSTLIPQRWYLNYDAPGRSDPYLSSLLAAHPNANSYVWPWISAPLGDYGTPTIYAEPFFSDPRAMTATGIPTTSRYATMRPGETAYPGRVQPGDDDAVMQRQNAIIGFVNMNRPASPSSPLSDNTRVYPAIAPNGVGGVYLAGDADGDGIADAGMMPVALDPTQATTLVARYLDTKNNVVYYASYRVVDNSAKLNLNTALDKRGDIVDLTTATSGTENQDKSTTGRVGPSAGSNFELRNFLSDNLAAGAGGVVPADTVDRVGPAVAGTFGPNYGFFRSNVGLNDLVRKLLTPINQQQDPNDFNRYPAEQELRRLADARFPLLKQNPGTGYYNPTNDDNKDISRLATTFTSAAVTQFRLGTYQAPSALGSQVYSATPATYSFFQFRSFNDLLEQQVARRPNSPGGYLWSNSATAASIASNGLTSLGGGDAASLGAKDGSLVNSLISPGTAESALMFTLRMNAPNVNSNGDEPWGWFPPNAVDLWYGWTQDFGKTVASTPPTIAAIEGAPVTSRAYSYDATNAPAISGYLPGKPAGTADVVLPHSPRALFTTYNGITTVTPRRGDSVVKLAPGPNAAGPTPGLPIGMPAYSSADVRLGTTAIANSVLGSDPLVAGVTFTYPPQKVSAATGTKEQLWRAFWSAMTQQTFFQYTDVNGALAYGSFWDVLRPLAYPVVTPGTYDPTQFYSAFRSSDRWESDEFNVALDPNRAHLPSPTGTPASPLERQAAPTEVLSQRRMALIRSAVAACNTIDLRDSDNDITAMDVDITDDNTRVAAAGNQQRYYARVYGTEKQLVISGVYLQGGTTPYVAVEIYNPTDIPIRLSAYRLAIVNRTSTAPALETGTIVQQVGATPIRLDSTNTDVLQPGGYVIVESGPTPTGGGILLPAATAHAPSAPTATPEVYRISSTDGIQGHSGASVLGTFLVANATRNTELVLTRTRRADGEAFTDQTAATAGGVRQAIENEVIDVPTEATTDVTTLVPVDAVDTRLVVSSSTGTPPRWSYTRARPTFPAVQPPYGPANGSDPLLSTSVVERPGAWQCFYAGEFYPLRLAGPGPAPRVTSQSSGTISPDENYAWRDLSAAAVVDMGEATPNAAAYQYSVSNTHSSLQGALLAPTVPIQNSSPYDPYTETNRRTINAPGTALDETTRVFGIAAYNAQLSGGNPGLRGIFHLINRFPYNTPFARDLDLMSIPYIGTYKIYRYDGTTTNLYEYVPLPMDAVAVASDPTEAAVTVATKTNSVGRFDQRINEPATSTLLNDWSANLTDYVTARRAPYRTYFPDIANNTPMANFLTGLPTTYLTQDQRYAQDGPVLGTAATTNGFDDVGWTSFTERDTTASDAALTGTTRTGFRGGIDLGTGTTTTLTQGVVNLNTAPQIVLRELPWFVDPSTGQTDFTNTTDPNMVTLDTATRTVVDTLETQRDTLAAASWNPKAASAIGQQFGFESLQRLNEVAPTLKTAPAVTTPPTAAQAMLLGMLNPVNRSPYDTDYQYELLNVNRLSNLTSQRSDVFTVYVTVQAWTWAPGFGGTQNTETRLVGERRASFIVDRSKITESNYDVSNLVVLPIERE